MHGLLFPVRHRVQEPTKPQAQEIAKMARTVEEITKQIQTLQAELDALTTSGDWVVVRSSPSGCWLGKLVYQSGSTVKLEDARRLWYWDGAASLSQLALEGVSRPGSCKFPPAVPSVTVLEVCEIIPASSQAVQSVQAVEEWKQ
jgi:hypothetical protein